MTELPLLANLIGAVGFAGLILATQMATKARFLAVDFAGVLLVAAHYALLDAPSGVVYSLIYAAADLAAAFEINRKWRQKLFGGLYLITAGLLIYWSFEATAMLSFAGTVFAIAARQQSRLWALNAFILLSTFGWGSFGWMTGSYSQIIFSFVYGLASGYRAVRLFHRDGEATAAARSLDKSG